MTDPIPTSIVTAICFVQARISVVKKDSRNQHGGYQFASTDSIYAALTAHLAHAGLAIVGLEDEPIKIERFEKDGKTVQWCRAVYRFVLATNDATWTDPGCTRTCMMQFTGPQTFMSMQSYCEKSFLRSLFKLPTGDMDLDQTMQADTLEDQAALNTPRKPKSSAAAKRNGDDKVFNEIRRSITNSLTRDMLLQIPQLYSEELSAMPSRWKEMVDDEYSDRMDALAGAI